MPETPHLSREQRERLERLEEERKKILEGQQEEAFQFSEEHLNTSNKTLEELHQGTKPIEAPKISAAEPETQSLDATLTPKDLERIIGNVQDIIENKKTAHPSESVKLFGQIAGTEE